MPRRSPRSFGTCPAGLPAFRLLALILFVPITWPAPSLAVEAGQRFAAGLSDGTRLAGERLEGWHLTTPKPTLEGQPLLSPDRPLLWLRDRTKLEVRPQAFVEMINGDRLPGSVARFEPAGASAYQAFEDRLWVEPSVELLPAREAARPELRVGTRWVRRIVWVDLGRDRLRPSTALLRDGSRVQFRSMRFEPQGVTLLVETGTRGLAFDQLAELHLPVQPFWPRYLEQLALLTSQDVMSQEGGRMLQLQTTDGLIATTSFERTDNYPRGQAGDPDAWVHGLHPIWSDDALWVPGRNTSIRRSFAIHEIPLSLVQLRSSEQRTLIGETGVDWVRDESLLASPLRGAGKDFGWGFGVHAYHRLDFPLPPLPSKLAAQLGLDPAMGTGGCIRGRFRLVTRADGDPASEAESRSLTETPVFAGSETTHSLQASLPAHPAQGEGWFSLEVDPAAENRPPGADPLDIRDVTNWLEPTLTLEAKPLDQHLATARLRAFDVWHPWEVKVGENSTPEELASLSWSSQWNEAVPSPGRFELLVSTSKLPLTLRRKIASDTKPRYVVVAASTTNKTPKGPRIVVKLDGETVLEAPVPLRNARQEEAEPLIVAIPPTDASAMADAAAGSGDQLVEVIQTGSDDKAFVLWSSVRISRSLPMVRTVLEDDHPVETIGAAGPATPGEELPRAVAVPMSEAYSGAGAVRLPAGGRYRIQLDPASLRAYPQWGEYRFVTFVVWKRGGGSASIDWIGQREGDEPLVFRSELGRPATTDNEDSPPSAARVVSAWNQPLPDKWVAITRDLYSDFGETDLAEIQVTVPDGEWLMLDHVYLGRKSEDFRRPELPPPR